MPDSRRTYLYVVFIHGLLFEAKQKILALPLLLFQLHRQRALLVEELGDGELRFADRLLHLLAILNIINNKRAKKKKKTMGDAENGGISKLG